MNGLKRYLVTVPIFGMLLAGTASCEQFSRADGAQKPGMITIAVKPDILAEGNIPPLTITFESQKNSYKITSPIDAEGITRIDDIVPGEYNITVSGRDENSIFAGGLTRQALISDRGEDNPLEVKVRMSRFGAICFKEIFTNCSKNKSFGDSSEGYYKKDQYYEIYNNSDEVFYLDSLCITTLQPDQNAFDLEFNTWDDADADDYVYARLIWIIPGSGKDYPLEPGQSAIIAEFALDHSQPGFNPDSPADLRSAEFEAWIPAMSATVSNNLANNMELYLGTAGNVRGGWFTTVFGCAYALFKATGPIDEENDIRRPNNQPSPARHFRIRLDRCLDVVEAVRDEATQQKKRVPPILDAGAITIGSDIYESISYVRKVDEEKSAAKGRIVLQDTNNTTDDFELQSPPVLRRGLPPSSIPSWNTWANN
jgi:hypothetical protein